MDTGKVVFGAIVILVAIWMMFFLTNPTARFLGGGIVAIVGIATLWAGFKETPKKKERK